MLGSIMIFPKGSHMEPLCYRSAFLPRPDRYSIKGFAPPVPGRCMGFASPSYSSRPRPGADCSDTLDVSGPQCGSGR